MKKLDELISKFIKSEGKFTEPSMRSYIQSLEEAIMKFEARTLSESRRLEMMKEQIKGIRRHSRRLEEKMNLLENEKKALQEKLSILEEKNTLTTNE